MVMGQQVRPAQVSPYGQVTGLQDISTLLTAIMPIIMIVMLMMMLMPMFKGMAKGFEA